MVFLAELHSEYFRRSWRAIGDRDAGQQHLNALIANPVDKPALLKVFDQQMAGQTLETALRRARQLVVMALMERDLTAQASLNEICTAMTAMAEIVTKRSIDAATAELVDDFGTPRDQDGTPIDLIAVGMGKCGAYELNVSSDLDLILLIRGDGETDGISSDGSDARRGSIAAIDFAHRVARRAINKLAEATGDGFVFRIDTRLRPNGDSGPLVCTFAALEDYFQIQGREWERFAWLKGRVIASGPLSGDTQTSADIHALHDIVAPFVFRRYLDYEIFAALRHLHALIQQEARKRDAQKSEGLDVKLGRGGIREVEFIAQLFQIVRGGKDSALRDPATLTSLATLAERGLLPADEAAKLADAYRVLRRVEHMLQYREDQQTHYLAASLRPQIADMMSLSEAELDRQLAQAKSIIEQVFDNLLAPSADQDASTEQNQIDNDRELPARFDKLLQSLHDGARYRGAKPDAQRIIDQLMATAIARDISDNCATRLLSLLETVCRRPGYLALLAQYPVAFDRVLAMLDSSEWAARYLTLHPVLLDELIDGNLYQATDFPQWQIALRAEIATATMQGSADTERQMDIGREWHHAQLFRILARELNGNVSMEQVSDELSELADHTLEIAIETVWAQLRTKFRDAPKFATIAYGRLGGKELGYASDLDLVFLFEDSDGRAGHAYAQLAQRLSTWLSAQTSAGQIFDIDLRLRPNGDAGLLISSLVGFEDYQRQSAWVWEHQALTRARFCAGDKRIGESFESLRRTLLCEAREVEPLRNEITKMRRKIRDGHPNRSELFDLKHDSGGMVDIEFSVQFLVLKYSRQFATLADNVGNIALLNRAAQLGLIDAELADQVAQAYRQYRQKQHILRMQGAQFARVQPATVRTEVASVSRLWNTLFGA